jgi:hypothetical protein
MPPRVVVPQRIFQDTEHWMDVREQDIGFRMDGVLGMFRRSAMFLGEGPRELGCIMQNHWGTRQEEVLGQALSW